MPLVPEGAFNTYSRISPRDLSEVRPSVRDCLRIITLRLHPGSISALMMQISMFDPVMPRIWKYSRWGIKRGLLKLREGETSLKFNPPLERAILIKRYKRFLADVKLPSGDVLTIHCPNTGSMKNCADPGTEVFYSSSDNPRRKYANTWELARTSRQHYIGINTVRANQLVKEAIEEKIIAEINGYDELQTEVRYGSENSRIDILLTGNYLTSCYVEVKSVTLLEFPISSGQGFFPDAISNRGRKHLRELMQMVREGNRAVLVFCVQHSGIRSVHPAIHIDAAYANTLADAVNNGVEVLAYKCRMAATGSKIVKSIPFDLSGPGS